MLTVSIVTYRTDLQELDRCLDSLAGAGVERIYIVDNGQESRTRDYAGSRGTEYIGLPNPGYGAGHNAAMRRASELGSDYHLVLNSDVYFKPDTLRAMVAAMEADPSIGAMHPRVLNPDGTPQFTARLLPTPLDVFGRRFLPRALFRRRNDRYLLKQAPPEAILDVPYFQGSFMLLNMKALRQTGLFDERFFMYPEDIDLTRRLHRHFKTLLWPEAEVVHDHRAASYESGRMLWIHVVNMYRYFRKWGWWLDPERRRFNRRILRDIAEYEADNR